MTEIVPLTDDVQWIFDCHSVGDEHLHVSQYVVRAGERYVLVDAGLEFEEYLEGAIDECTDGRGVDALLLTHSILPHTRSAGAVRERWDDVTVVSAASSAPLVGVSGRSKVVNSTEEILGRQFAFADPLLTDVVNSNWVFDAESGTLFTAEGLGHYHRPPHCGDTSASMADGIPFDRVHAFQRDKLPFLQYVDPAKLRRGVAEFFEAFDVERIAPSHGNPVETPDIDRYLERVCRSAEELAAADGDVLERGTAASAGASDRR